ncbi:CocE/NonD family hydrolase [Lipingzhangella sp. LS1_29]|uniref:CocE/NonD family hydrolase n=1 Tax=Lipingzhangella rawalii TaxID=2055835 RepID=A0ABU2H5S5_9ACTN|nr:CocE/NonD family hydrolase [Lipingzhangella rawalii]MDS1270657.1 CocE/NonD family hydrolase [Lipingzhangella rawalii]
MTETLAAVPDSVRSLADLADSHRIATTVTMRDGVALYTQVVMPARCPAAAVVIRTPYGCSSAAAETAVLVAAGFAVVVQDLRGRGDSGGWFRLGADERNDGVDTLDWVQAQSWCDGTVFLAGTGYAAFAAWCAAEHSAVAGIASRQPWPALGPPRLDEQLWWYTDILGPAGAHGRCALGTYERTLAEQPQLYTWHHARDLPEHWPYPLPSWPPRPSSQHAAARLLARRVRHSRLPSLHLGSWLCRTAGTTLRLAALARHGREESPSPAQGHTADASRTETASPPPEWPRGTGAAPGEAITTDTVMGAWADPVTHRLQEDCALDVPAMPDPNLVLCSWLEARRAGRPWRESRRCLVLGVNRWVDTDPVLLRQARSIAHLAPFPGAPTRVCHDPTDPYPALPHSADLSTLDHRVDVLRLEVPDAPPWIGAATLTVGLGTDCSVEVVATLVQRHADGRRTVLADATTPLTAGTHRAEFRLSPVAVAVPAGQRLEVEVTVGRYPHYWGGDQPTVLTLEPACASPRLDVPPLPAPPESAATAVDRGDAETARHDLMVDARTGVLRSVDRITPEEWWPSGLHVYTASVAAIGDHLPWPADLVATGTAFDDPRQARISAIGEAIERYSGNFVPDTLRRASYRELLAAGQRAVNPHDLALYSARQYATPGFPFVAVEAGTRVLWTAGRELHPQVATRPDPSSDRDGTGGPGAGEATASVWVPAALVYPDFATPPRQHEPLTNYPMLAGIAAGSGRNHAQAAALEEIIERDATVIWWANALPARPVDITGTSAEAVLCPDTARGPGWYRARGATGECAYRVIALPTVFDVAVLGVLVDDPRHDITMIGFAARPDPAQAVGKALAEAVTLRRYQLGLLDPDGDIWRLAGGGQINGAVFHPLREDRRYADSYRDDYRDVVDLACHGQLWLDPRMRRHLGPATASNELVHLTELPHHHGDPRQTYLRQLRRQGIRAYGVDLTTADVAAAGFRVERVVAPGAYSNPPAAFPLCGGDRLYHDPVTLGLRTRPSREEELCTVPLPHV